MADLPTILSLCDYSGNWAKPWKEAGYKVIQVDLKHGTDIRTVPYFKEDVYGILAAPPCTDFSVSGAQYWPAKDASGDTLGSLALVDACLRAVAIYRPRFWALENPVGRLRKWLGPPRTIFHPCDFGGWGDESDAYTKKTLLWGEFAELEHRYVAPIMYECNGKRGSWMWAKLGGKSEKTKELRSTTPLGFSRAFFEANKL